MRSLFEQVFSLLTTQAGSLTYHLVLAFSIVGALQISFSQFQRRSTPRIRRSLFGLGLLLLLQLGLFISSGLAWQELITGNLWLPSLDRAVTLLSLVLIIWLWVFPDPSPTGDTSTLILGLLVITAAIFGALWRSQHDPQAAFNGSLLDVIVQVSNIAFVLVGILFLTIRKTDGFGFGVSMLALIGVGAGLHLAFLPYSGDYPAAVRLAQMAAFPLLLMLPLRPGASVLEASETELEKFAALTHDSIAASKAHYYADPQVWQSLMKLTTETKPEKICKEITSMTAKVMQADLCLLLAPVDENGTIALQCGYDLSQSRHIEHVSLDCRSLPMLTSSMRMGRMRRFSANSASPDLTSLMNALNLEKIGNLLFMPVLAPDGRAIASLVLLSPYTGKDWSGEEHAFLTVLARLLVHFLQRSQEMTSLKEEIVQVRQMSLFAQNQMAQAAEEGQKLRGQLAVMQEESARNQTQLNHLSNLVASQAAAQDTLEQLQAENEKLKEAAALVSTQAGNGAKPDEGELRMALEEIAFLSSALAEAEQKISANRISQPDAVPSSTPTEVITSIAHELRQPLSSIVGYTDFLLSESVGILGAMQRKYMERIKVSTERMGRLVDDLIQTLSVDKYPSQLDVQETDLCVEITGALTDAESALQEKQIALRVDLPEKPLPIHTDLAALRKVLDGLLHNAQDSTLPGGKIEVDARLESSETDQDYVLVRVTNSGEGIAAQDLTQVFAAPGLDATGPQLGSNPDGSELSSVKTLVELLAGRIWVDSEPGQGATFSVLLPVFLNAVSQGDMG